MDQNLFIHTQLAGFNEFNPVFAQAAENEAKYLTRPCSIHTADGFYWDCIISFLWGA